MLFFAYYKLIYAHSKVDVLLLCQLKCIAKQELPIAQISIPNSISDAVCLLYLCPHFIAWHTHTAFQGNKRYFVFMQFRMYLFLWDCLKFWWWCARLSLLCSWKFQCDFSVRSTFPSNSINGRALFGTFHNYFPVPIIDCLCVIIIILAHFASVSIFAWIVNRCVLNKECFLRLFVGSGQNLYLIIIKNVTQQSSTMQQWQFYIKEQLANSNCTSPASGLACNDFLLFVISLYSLAISQTSLSVCVFVLMLFAITFS